MAGGSVPDNGGRVTTRELYDALKEINKDFNAALKEQSKERGDMEERIMEKIDCVPALQNQVETNSKEIDYIRKQSRWSDMGLGAFTIMVNIVSDAWRRNG